MLVIQYQVFFVVVLFLLLFFFFFFFFPHHIHLIHYFSPTFIREIRAHSHLPGFDILLQESLLC